MAARVAAVTRLGSLEIELRLGMALAAGDVLMHTLLRKLGVALLVVVKLQPRLGRLPRHFAVAALAAQECPPIETVGLIAFVATAAILVFAQVGSAARLVGLFVAVLAL